MALRARPTPTVNGAPPVPSSPPPEFYAEEFKPKAPDAPEVVASEGTITITAEAPPESVLDETHLSAATRAELAAGREVAARQSSRQNAELEAGRAAVAAATAKLASETPAVEPTA